MKTAPVNPLSAEFLYELYAAALRYDTLCGVVAEMSFRFRQMNFSNLRRRISS